MRRVTLVRAVPVDRRALHQDVVPHVDSQCVALTHLQRKTECNLVTNMSEFVSTRNDESDSMEQCKTGLSSNLSEKTGAFAFSSSFQQYLRVCAELQDYWGGSPHSFRLSQKSHLNRRSRQHPVDDGDAPVQAVPRHAVRSRAVRLVEGAVEARIGQCVVRLHLEVVLARPGLLALETRPGAGISLCRPRDMPQMPPLYCREGLSCRN